jgi:HEAT repeat protein
MSKNTKSSGEAAPSAPARKSAAELIAVLKSEAGHKEKADACRELSIIGGADAVPALAALLTDEKLSHMARYGLEPIPDGSVDDALREALGKVKGKTLVGIIGSLGVRRDARSVESLARLVGDGDANVAQTAARSLAKIASAGAAGALKEKLGGAPAALRGAIADAALTCAEKLMAAGQKDLAMSLYEAVGKADLPGYVRQAARQGAGLSSPTASN